MWRSHGLRHIASPSFLYRLVSIGILSGGGKMREDLDQRADAARRHFGGRIIVGRDLMEI